MSDGGLEPAAAACLFPGFDGLTAPDWVRRGGFGGVVLFARNIRDPEQLAELTSSAAAGCSSPWTRRAGTSRGSRPRRGSSFPGNLALGAVDDVGADRGAWPPRSAASWRAWA